MVPRATDVLAVGEVAGLAGWRGSAQKVLRLHVAMHNVLVVQVPATRLMLPLGLQGEGLLGNKESRGKHPSALLSVRIMPAASFSL